METNLSEFSKDGLNLGKDTRLMTYLYGLSDFWSFIFEDSEKNNLLLEAATFSASEIYNNFLQRTTQISLEDIHTEFNYQSKLIILNSLSITSDVETYQLSEKITTTKYIANRPFLPTAYYESGVDFHLDPETGKISFNRPIQEMKFATRVRSDGSIDYALWLVDAAIDDEMVYDYFAKLIGIDKPERSTDNFKNFVYGLYYLYIHGPNLDQVRRGLNLCLGIPVARDTERVLEIRKHLNTDQYLVITDQNSYLIPYGLEPTVVVDQDLVTGDEISSWVEVKDYTHDNEWWINLMIPKHILRHIPPDLLPGGYERNRYATSGSFADWIMANYLKQHTFLVRVKTLNFKNIQTFQEIADVIRRVKPAYTTPIYVWTVPTTDEELVLDDKLIEYILQPQNCESLSDGIWRFIRDAAVGEQLPRACPQFTRISASGWLDDLMGRNSEMNGDGSITFNGGTVEGFIAPQKTYRNLNSLEKGWLRTLTRDRDNEQFVNTRGTLNLGLRSIEDVSSTVYGGVGVKPFAEQFTGFRMVYLYTTTWDDVVDKFAKIYKTPPTDQYLFTLFTSSYYSDAINEHPLNGSVEFSYYQYLKDNFDYYFTRGSTYNNLGPFCPKDAYISYKPNITELMEGDFLAFTRIVDKAVGVFWITRNFTAQSIPYHSHPGTDQFILDFTQKFSRAGAPHGSPAYLLRGGNLVIGYNTSNAINEKEIDGDIQPSTKIYRRFKDDYNTLQDFNRGGTNTVRTHRTWKDRNRV